MWFILDPCPAERKYHFSTVLSPWRGPCELPSELSVSTGGAKASLGVTSRATHHEGADHDVRHLGQLVVEQGGGGVVSHLGTKDKGWVRATQNQQRKQGGAPSI